MLHSKRRTSSWNIEKGEIVGAERNIERGEEDHLKETQTLLEQLPRPAEKLKFPLIQGKALSIPAKVQVAKEVLIWRVHDIAGSAITLYDAKKQIPAFILTRAVFETAAMMFLIHERLEHVRDTRRLGDISAFLSRVVAGSSTDTGKWPDGIPRTPIRIGKAVKRLDKKFRDEVRRRGLNADYAFLSDFVHPSCFGTLMAYAETAKNNNVISFNLGKAQQQLKELSTGLIMLNMGLDIAQHYYRELGNILKELESIV
jgi:hypothetical protein